MPVSEKTYEQLALEDPEGQWELVCGRLRQKPGMTYEHNELQFEIAYALRSQLDPGQFAVRSNAGRARNPAGNYYIPDVIVIPVAAGRAQAGTRRLEVYREPLPLVVEVWSPSTGEYDVDSKLPDYQARGDLEIWRVHPYERTITRWRRQPGGGYEMDLLHGGTIECSSLPGVAVDFDQLFSLLD
jgi:Uma2 family endonuclease